MEKEQAAAAVRAFLAALDVDVSARGMERTPERVAEMYAYLFGGLGRVDLAMAAQEAAKFPDTDRGLDQLRGLLDDVPE